MRKIFAILFLVTVFFWFSSQFAHAFSFAVMGDTQKFQNKNSSLKKTVKSLQKYQDVDFLVGLGDMCSGSRCDNKLRKWKKIVAPLNVPIYPVMGNHDFVSLGFWNSFFGPPQNGPVAFSGICYSFDFENSHFVVLSSSYPRWHIIDSTQRAWLENDLDENTKENVFVFFHAPAFPVDGKIANSLDAEPTERDAFWQILDNYNVTAVFSGHEHQYSRKLIDSSVFPGAQNEIYQFIEGNTDAYSHSKPIRDVDYYFRKKSFLIVNVDGEQITVNAYKSGGTLLDSFSFSKSVSAPNSLLKESDNPIETETQNQDSFVW